MSDTAERRRAKKRPRIPPIFVHSHSPLEAITDDAGCGDPAMAEGAVLFRPTLW
jgi:hypothetical protein